MPFDEISSEEWASNRETNESETHEAPAKPTPFDPSQKARVSEIAASVARRAGSEARAEAARLKTELDALKAASLLPASTAADLSAASGQLAATKAELAAARESQAQASIQAALVASASIAGFLNPAEAALLLRASVATVDGVLCAVDANGQPRFDSFGEIMTVDQLATEFAGKRAYMVRGQIKGGIGSTPAAYSALSGPREPQLESLFGKGSDAGAANRLGLANPREYSRLRALARSKGLI